MDRNGLRLQRYVCKTCRSYISPPLGTAQAAVHSRSFRALHTDAPRRRPQGSTLNPVQQHQRRWKSKLPTATAHAEEMDLNRLEGQVNSALSNNAVPPEQECTAILKSLENAAQSLVHAHDLETPDLSSAEEGSATSAILSLEERVSRSPSRRRTAPARNNDMVNALSLLAYRFVTHPNVFITTDALKHYTKLQALLSQPESLPEVFDLFASKPVPAAAKTPADPPSFTKANPDAANAAVPISSASLALATALHVRKLPLALSIIMTSYQRPAFKRAKFTRRAMPPLLGASLTPLAMWTLASNMSTIQTGLDPATFTNMAFAGFATYLGAVGTIGYVAMTSANDQMRRVTWVPGMPLYERWVREEERAAVDRVVCAWGFKDQRRWGEEEGDDWAELKEWAGRAGMIVDKVSLMEGMQ